ncbi:hypothetical protein CEQ28_018275 [Hafnia alvei]|nr:hypothetical protein CEQ28_018275 [Hafnia alvei]
MSLFIFVYWQLFGIQLALLAVNVPADENYISKSSNLTNRNKPHCYRYYAQLFFHVYHNGNAPL